MIKCCDLEYRVPFLPCDVAIISSTRLYFLMVLLSSSMCLSFSSFAAMSDSTAFLSFSTSVSAQTLKQKCKYFKNTNFC